MLDLEPGKGQKYAFKFYQKIGRGKLKGLYEIRDTLKDDRIEFWIKETIESTKK